MWPAVMWGTGGRNRPKPLAKRGSRCPSLLGNRKAEGTHDEFILGLYLAEGLTVSFSPVTMVEPHTPGQQPAYWHSGTAIARYGDLPEGRNHSRSLSMGHT